MQEAAQQPILIKRTVSLAEKSKFRWTKCSWSPGNQDFGNHRKPRWGQPPSAIRRSDSAGSLPSKTLSSFDWTAEGGCPHVVRGKPRLSQYFLSLPTPAGIILRLEDT